MVMIGSPTVPIHGKPAARWAPSGDLTACGAFLGDPRLHEDRHHRKWGKRHDVAWTRSRPVEYVRKNLENDLTDEGAANFSNARARGEIRASGGPDIGIAGSQQERYQSIYDEYQAGRIDQPTAEQKMGAPFGGGERTSTTDELYEDYYGKGYRSFWDKNLGNVPPGGKAP
jgi:hypothetical protein